MKDQNKWLIIVLIFVALFIIRGVKTPEKKNKSINQRVLVKTPDTESNKGYTPLIHAIKCNDLEKIKKIVKENPELLDCKFKNALVNGWTPIFLAIERGNEDIVTYLISAGASINIHDEKGNTPLMIACKKQQNGIVRILINKGADLNAINSSGESALYFATLEGSSDIAKVLIEHGANVNLKRDIGHNTPWQSPLMLATSYCDDEVVKLLVEKGAHINERNYNGETPLYNATIRGNVKIVEYFISKGANIKSPVTSSNPVEYNSRHLTLLHVAAYCDFPDIIKVLIKNGLSADETIDRKGKTALWYAAFYNKINAAKCLISNGANVNFNCKDGTPLHAAIRKGHIGMVKLLIAKGANVNLKSEDYSYTVAVKVKNTSKYYYRTSSTKTTYTTKYEKRQMEGITPLTEARQLTNSIISREIEKILLNSGVHLEEVE